MDEKEKRKNHLTEITEQVIAGSINKDASDAETRPGQALPASAAMEEAESN